MHLVLPCHEARMIPGATPTIKIDSVAEDNKFTVMEHDGTLLYAETLCIHDDEHHFQITYLVYIEHIFTRKTLPPPMHYLNGAQVPTQGGSCTI